MLLLFFLVWIIFNGAITTEICIFGVVVAFLMFGFVCKFMDYSWRKEKLLIQRSWIFPALSGQSPDRDCKGECVSMSLCII